METKEILNIEQEIFEEKFNRLSKKDQEKIKNNLDYSIKHCSSLKKRASVLTSITTIITISLIVYIGFWAIILLLICIYFLTRWIRLEKSYWHLSEKKKYTQ